MKTRLETPVQYYLSDGSADILLNQYIGSTVQISALGTQCMHCKKKKKLYRQGYCYNCFYKVPQTGDWIMRPELCKAHLGVEDRDLAFEKSVQLAPHVVYLAISSGVKVGITRSTQIPTRWIDQGASQALAIMEAPNRYLVGITEVALKTLLADKTNWRKMLKNDIADDDILDVRHRILDTIPDETKAYIMSDNLELVSIKYPVKQYPETVKSLNLDKSPIFTGTLVGIKGQYLMFDDGTVFNVRNNEGRIVRMAVVED